VTPQRKRDLNLMSQGSLLGMLAAALILATILDPVFWSSAAICLLMFVAVKLAEPSR